MEHDADGYPLHNWTDREVWADKHSVTRSEFYSANAAGVNAQIAFFVHTEDYQGERDLLCDGRHYQVIRAYQRGAGTVELTCQDKAVEHG